MSCEIVLKFKDSDDPIVLTEKELICKIPVFKRALNPYSFDDQFDPIFLLEPFEMKFSKASGEFLFANFQKYKAPEVGDNQAKPEDYPEINEKNLDELKEILEFSTYLECYDFMKCVGFVMAKKLNEKDPKEIAEFLGLQHESHKYAPWIEFEESV